MTVRYLPAGTLRRLRWKWFALGIVIGAGGSAALAMYLAAITPPELGYRSAPATEHPTPGPVAELGEFPPIPPCLGQGKDCSPLDVDAARQAPRSRTVPDGAVPTPDVPTHTVPEPGALALVAIGLAALAIHRSHA